MKYKCPNCGSEKWEKWYRKTEAVKYVGYFNKKDGFDGDPVDSEDDDGPDDGPYDTKITCYDCEYQVDTATIDWSKKCHTER